MRKALTIAVWIVALVLIAFHASEMYSYVWNVAGGPLSETPSAVQQAAMAAYRTGMMVLFYAIGRGLTDIIKTVVPSDE
jgi:hypothetical protein